MSRNVKNEAHLNCLRRQWLYPGLLSVALTFILYLWVRPLSLPFIDDTAILLRYLDNVRQGAFYTFNKVDGPVFGISSPLHFILCALFVLASFSSEIAVVLANSVGSFFFFLVLFRIFRLVYPHDLVAAILTAVIAFGSQYLVLSFFSGLETPLHLALILAAVWFFMLRSRFLYFFAALSVISKLDAVGIWFALCALALIRDRFEAKSAWQAQLKQNAKPFVIWSLLPLALWVLFSFWLFGSPLPQSFNAKMFYYGNYHGLSGRFLEPFFASLALRVAAITGGLFMLGAGCLAVWHRSLNVSFVLSTISAISLIEYCFYNFAERSYWYYALPEITALIAVIALPGVVWFEWRLKPNRRAVLVPALFTVLVLFVFGPRRFIADELVKDVQLFCRYGEGERLELAKQVSRLTPPTAVLLAGHGHFFRQFSGYAADFSGLNSRLATALKLRMKDLIEHFQPATLVMHGLPDEALQRSHRMALRLSAYNMQTFGPPPWRVFTLGDGDGSVVRLLDTPGNTATRKQTRFEVDSGLALKVPAGSVQRFEMGVVRRRSEQSVLMTAYGADGTTLMRQCTVPATSLLSGGHETTVCEFVFAENKLLQQILLSSALPVTILSPIIVQRPVDEDGPVASR